MPETPQNVRYRHIRHGDRHGTSKKLQMSDGTGLDPYMAKYNGEGSLTPSTLKEGDIATVSGQNSWFREQPIGTIDGTNRVFHTTYAYANPYDLLELNGDVQDPFNQYSTTNLDTEPTI